MYEINDNFLFFILFKEKLKTKLIFQIDCGILWLKKFSVHTDRSNSYQFVNNSFVMLFQQKDFYRLGTAADFMHRTILYILQMLLLQGERSHRSR